MQVVLSHYTSISSKTDEISKCVVSVRLSAPKIYFTGNKTVFIFKQIALVAYIII
jgi:hypothetical protein